MLDTLASLGYSHPRGDQAGRVAPAGDEHSIHRLTLVLHCLLLPSRLACQAISSAEATGDHGLVTTYPDRFAIGTL